MGSGQPETTDIQNTCPVFFVCAFLSVFRQVSGQVKQWYLGFNDATVRRPVVWTATASGFVYGANDSKCFRKPFLNWPAVCWSVSTAARCSGGCGSVRSGSNGKAMQDSKYIPQPYAASERRWTESKLAILALRPRAMHAKRGRDRVKGLAVGTML